MINPALLRRRRRHGGLAALLALTPARIPDPTFTRASDARYYDSSGVVQTALADVLRDSHYIDAERTILLEGQRTNLLLHSEAFDNAAWSKNASITANSTVAPDGTTTADTLADVGAGFAYVQQAVTVANNSAFHTLSVFVRKDSDQSRFPEFGIDLTGGTTVLRYRVQLNTATGATGTRLQGASATVRVKDWGDYWRIEITGENNSTGNTTLTAIIHPAVTTTLGVAEDAAAGSIVAWGAQLEQAIFASFYIPATTATASRAVDDFALTQTWVSQEASRYLRYYDLATATFTDEVNVATRTGPDAVTVDRAYTHIYYFKGSLALAEARTKAGVS